MQLSRATSAVNYIFQAFSWYTILWARLGSQIQIYGEFSRSSNWINARNDISGTFSSPNCRPRSKQNRRMEMLDISVSSGSINKPPMSPPVMKSSHFQSRTEENFRDFLNRKDLWIGYSPSVFHYYSNLKTAFYFTQTSPTLVIPPETVSVSKLRWYSSHVQLRGPLCLGGLTVFSTPFFHFCTGHFSQIWINTVIGAEASHVTRTNRHVFFGL